VRQLSSTRCSHIRNTSTRPPTWWESRYRRLLRLRRARQRGAKLPSLDGADQEADRGRGAGECRLS
jgi:hypothetical protein